LNIQTNWRTEINCCGVLGSEITSNDRKGEVFLSGPFGELDVPFIEIEDPLALLLEDDRSVVFLLELRQDIAQIKLCFFFFWFFLLFFLFFRNLLTNNFPLIFSFSIFYFFFFIWGVR
jgi:hypothetical protein